MKNKIKKPVNKITELNKKIKELQSDVDSLNLIKDKNDILIRRINSILGSSWNSDPDDIFAAIGSLKNSRDEARNILKESEGKINNAIHALTSENNRLWYMIRVALKDPTIEITDVKPGEQKNYDIGRRIINPFLNN